jgi:outer membrane protein OmpA-like peptidoglycan-associated protein
MATEISRNSQNRHFGRSVPQWGPNEGLFMISMSCESKSGRNIRLWSLIKGLIQRRLQRRPFREEILSAPFINATKTMMRYRYVLLAGTLLTTLAVPQWSAVSDARARDAMRDGSFVIAQRPDPNDPKQKGKQQGKQPPQGQQGQGQPQGQPQGGQPGGPQPGQTKQFGKQPPAGGPPQPQLGNQPPAGGAPPQQLGNQPPAGGKGLPKQFGKQPPTGNQPPQLGNQPPAGGTPPQQQLGGQPPAGGAPQPQLGNQPPGGKGQAKQFGKQPPTGNQPPQQLGNQPPAGGTPPQQLGNQPPAGGTPQQRQFGNQPPAGGTPPQQLGNQPPAGGTPQQRQFGNQPPAGGPPQPQLGNQPPAGGPPQQFGNPPGGRPQIGAPQQPAQPNQPQVVINNNNTINVEQVRTQRRQTTDVSGRIIIEEPGNRHIVREGGRVIIRNDDNVRFKMFAPNAQVTRRGNENFMVYERPGGFQIINVTDANGQLVRRVRRGPDGREYVLVDNTRRGPGFGTGLAIGLAAGAVAGAVLLNLPAPVVTIPRERYIVSAGIAPPALLFETLDAPPLVAIERPYSLDEIRYNVELRDRVRRIDIDTITFETGSWEVSPSQYGTLAQIAQAMLRVIERNPETVFMIEGHTDAVGGAEDNLSLSDRRAESVAVILTQQFNIGPENLVTQGYGEQHLKIPTDGPSRENRRVAMRNITRLMQAQNGR